MGQTFTVTLPDIGEGVVEGEVIEWLKNVGDELKQDEPVVIVMTDKATVELPAPYPGKLSKQYYQAGQTAIKDKPLYEIELSREGETVAEIPKASENVPKEEKRIEKTPKEPRKNSGSEAVGVQALPSVRKMATDLGLDLSQIQGTGKNGRITEADLAQKVKQPCTTPVVPVLREGDRIIPHKGIKGLMAKKMAESKRHIPHFAFFEQAEAERLIKMREHFKKEGVKEGIEVTYMPFLIKALSLTILEFPEINSTYDEANQALILHQSHNIGIAMSTDQGLIVPVLKNVQDISLIDLIKLYAELKLKAMSNQLQSSDMKEGTVTLSNYGVVSKGGGLWATPVINFPEVAILAVARIQKQPIVKNDEVVARNLLNLSWSFDHRVIDGDRAAHCSHFFAQLIENPARLLA